MLFDKLGADFGGIDVIFATYVLLMKFSYPGVSRCGCIVRGAGDFA
jgi:hypothetical protein